MTVSVTPTSVYLIPAIGHSCSDAENYQVGVPVTDSLAQPYFSFTNFNISWSSGDSNIKLGLAYAQLNVTNPNISGTNNTYSCTISITDLQYLLNITGGVNALLPTPQNLTGPAGAATGAQPTYSAGQACNLSCGGITLVNPNQAMSASGTFFVQGFTQDSSGNTVPVSAQTSFTLNYVPPQ